MFEGLRRRVTDWFERIITIKLGLETAGITKGDQHHGAIFCYDPHHGITCTIQTPMHPRKLKQSVKHLTYCVKLQTMKTPSGNQSRMTLDSFLPIGKMREVCVEAHEAYINAKPYPHVVLDDFFDPLLVDQILTEFPKPHEIKWQKFDNNKEIKLAAAAETLFGPTTRLFMYHLNSFTFLEFLSKVTGIDNLIPDPGFDGGGLHQIPRGGKLGIHADFNRHNRYSLDRRLNLLLYLNRDWHDDYGGHLELWDRSMSRCETKVAPIFNRVVVFGTTDFTYHGHPDPLQCPEGMTRKSLALYYFTNGRPAEEVSGEHTTIFRPRNDSDFKPTYGQRLRGVVSDLVPPIIKRQFRKN